MRFTDPESWDLHEKERHKPLVPDQGVKELRWGSVNVETREEKSATKNRKRP